MFQADPKIKNTKEPINHKSPNPVSNKSWKPHFSMPALMCRKHCVWAFIVEWVLPPTSCLGFEVCDLKLKKIQGTNQPPLNQSTIKAQTRSTINAQSRIFQCLLWSGGKLCLAFYCWPGPPSDLVSRLPDCDLKWKTPLNQSTIRAQTRSTIKAQSRHFQFLPWRGGKFMFGL